MRLRRWSGSSNPSSATPACMQKYPWAKPTPPVNPSEWVLVWMCNNNLFLFGFFYNVTEIKYTKTNAKLHKKCHCGTEILFISICMWPSLILPQKHHSFSFLRNLKERESMGFMCADRPWGKVFCTFAHLHTWRPKSTSFSHSKLVPCILNHYSFIIS